MSSPLLAVPRGSFAHHAKQLQHLRHASSTVPSQLSLFKPPASIIKPWRAVTGAQEWQTSTYHYNKQTQKTLPTAQTTANKLLQDYATQIKSRGLASTGSSGTARSAIAGRRKTFEKMYVSGTSTKDYGDKIVVNAFMFDAVEAEAEERKRRLDALKQKSNEMKAERAQGQRRRAGGSGTGTSTGTGGAGGAARAGPGAGVRRVGFGGRMAGMGGAPGAGRRMPSRSGGVQRATGASR